MFAIMAAFGAVFVVGRRSESIRMMAAGRGADERWRSIDLRATAIAGLVLISAVIAAFVWEIAHGRSGQPYAPLGAIAGVSYLVALVWFRWRS
jgi:TRAP-type C4-dicarboxylate transport system permease small subunit